MELFTDYHERDDIVDFRNKAYLMNISRMNQDVIDELLFQNQLHYY